MPKLQSHDSWCAVAALQCALRVHGRRHKQAALARILGTNDEGTDEDDLIKALTRLGHGYQEFGDSSKRRAGAWLRKTVPDFPVLLCVDDWEHWVCVTNGSGRRLWLHDPSTAEWNRDELGSWPLLPERIIRRWKASPKKRPLFYGLAVLGRY